MNCIGSVRGSYEYLCLRPSPGNLGNGLLTHRADHLRELAHLQHSMSVFDYAVM